MTTITHGQSTSGQTWMQAINSNKHELALRIYTVIVLAHWAEHLTQAFQIYVMNWPIPASRGVIGHFYPWVVTSETLHYIYALVMLIGLWILKDGFVGREKKWWIISFAIQFWHHIEHGILQYQWIRGENLFGLPVPTSIVQLWFPRVELHLFYNAVVFIPMAVGMYYHLFPTAEDKQQHRCACAVH